MAIYAAGPMQLAAKRCGVRFTTVHHVTECTIGMTHVQSKWTTEESAMCEKFVNPKVGKCMDMCPKNEIVDREKQRRIHPFEMVPGTRRDQRPKADPERMVKEYCRSAAGKAEPSEEELRPPNVLMKTVKYLVNRLLTREDVKWLEIYNFVFDRMRCIRQDMVLQQLSPVHCIELLEPIVRFYIYAGYRLHHEQIHSYDPHINNSHIQQCLQKLLICYDDECQKAENRAEFESLYLLHNLGSVEASFHVIALPKYLRTHRHVHLATAINKAYRENNFIRLFRLTEQCSLFQAFSLHKSLYTIRRYALETLNAAYSSKNTKFPINILKQWLKFNSDEDAIKFVSMFGLTVVDGMVHFSRAAYSAPMQQPNVGSHCHLDSIDLSGEEIADVIWNKYTEP